MKNRYSEIKKLYDDYLILIKKKNKYLSYENDKEILDYIKFSKVKELKKRKINYLILENLDIIEMIDNKEKNKYYTYFIKVKIKRMLEIIKERMINEKSS